MIERISKRSKIFVSVDIEDKKIPKADYPDLLLLKKAYAILLKSELEKRLDGFVEDVHITDVIALETEKDWIVKELKLWFIFTPRIPMDVGEAYEAGGGGVFGTLALITIIVLSIATAWTVTVVTLNIDKIEPLVKPISFTTLAVVLFLVYLLMRK